MDFSAERKIMREKQQSCICNYESTRSLQQFQQMKISSQTSSSTLYRLVCALAAQRIQSISSAPWCQLSLRWRENIFSSPWGCVCSVCGVKLREYQWQMELKSYLCCEMPRMAHILTVKAQTGSHVLFSHKAEAVIRTRESLHYPECTHTCSFERVAPAPHKRHTVIESYFSTDML